MNLINQIQDFFVSLVGNKRTVGSSNDEEVNDERKRAKVEVPIDTRTLVELCEYASLEIIQKFVREGGDLNICDEIGRPPLHIACLHNRLDVVIFLLENGADVNKTNNNGYDAFAIVYGNYPYRAYHPEILLALLQCEVNPSVSDNIIFDRAVECGHFEIAKLIISRLKPENYTRPLSSALRDACGHGYYDMVNLLLQYGATVLEADWHYSSSCLYDAVEANTSECYETIKLILQHSLDLYTTGSELTAVFKIACKMCKMKVLKLLLAHGHIDINATDDKSFPLPILYSCQGRIEVFKLLLANGAEVNQATTNEGFTMLMMAAICKKYNRIKPLLEAGADVTAVDINGKTVLDYLEAEPAMLELCKEYADRNMVLQQPLLK